MEPHLESSVSWLIIFPISYAVSHPKQFSVSKDEPSRLTFWYEDILFVLFPSAVKKKWMAISPKSLLMEGLFCRQWEILLNIFRVDCREDEVLQGKLLTPHLWRPLHTVCAKWPWYRTVTDKGIKCTTAIHGGLIEKRDINHGAQKRMIQIHDVTHIPDICHRHHRRRLWRKNWSCGEILPMTCCQVENFSTW